MLDIQTLNTKVLQHFFETLYQDVIKKYKITRLGEEDVCGKPCVKYSCLIKGQGIRTKVQVWVWRGISLKKKVFTLPLNMEYEAIDVQEDVPIDPSVFVVPDYPLEQRKP